MPLGARGSGREERVQGGRSPPAKWVSERTNRAERDCVRGDAYLRY